MGVGYSPGLSFKPLTRSRSRLSLTLIITFMVVSSPILVFLNPVLISAKSNNIDTSSQHSGFSLEGTSSPMSPSTNVSPLDSDFTTQAALSSLSARPTNNIVNTNSFYDVVFLTASSGTIKTIEVTFPAGTTIPSGAFFNEAEGIGPGTASKSGQTITYTVNSAVNVPAGTKIRLEFANINNPLNPSASYQVTVTTRNAANTPIDGPTPSTAYTIKQIGVNAIADNAVWTNKIADGAVTSAKIPDNEIGGDKIIDFSITNEDLAFGSVRVNNHADIIFASCTINWGTVVQDGGTNAQCNIPFVTLGDHVIATQDDGIPGLTLTLALALADKVHLVVRNYGSTTDFGTVRYAIMIFKATT